MCLDVHDSHWVPPFHSTADQVSKIRLVITVCQQRLCRSFFIHNWQQIAFPFNLHWCWIIISPLSYLLIPYVVRIFQLGSASSKHFLIDQIWPKQVENVFCYWCGWAAIAVCLLSAVGSRCFPTVDHCSRPFVSAWQVNRCFSYIQISQLLEAIWTLDFRLTNVADAAPGQKPHIPFHLCLLETSINRSGLLYLSSSSSYSELHRRTLNSLFPAWQCFEGRS